MAKQRALLVAIDDYPGTLNDLPSCLADLAAMEALVADDFGFGDVTTLKNADATVANVEAAIQALFKDAMPDDQLLFFFSGHGAQSFKAGSIDESLVCHDGMFLDDRLVSLAKDLPVGVATFVFDACFSGGMEKRLYELVELQQEVSRIKTWTPENLEKHFADVIANEKDVVSYRPFGCAPIPTKWTTKSLKKSLARAEFSDAGDEAGQLQLNGLLISACKETETASASTPATLGLSAFTYCFKSVLKAAPVGASADEIVDQTKLMLNSMGFGQAPLVKSNPAMLSKRPFLGGRRSSPSKSFASDWPMNPPSSRFGPYFDGAKSWESRIPQLVPSILQEVLRALGGDASADQKLFGIDDTILIPAIASVVVAAMKQQKGFGIRGGAGVSTPFGGGQLGGEVHVKAWQDLIVPIVTEVVRELSKGEASNQKLFGIDDAILIPAIASVVAAAVKGQPQEKIFGIDDAILIPAIASIVAAAVKQQKGFGFHGGAGVSTPFGSGQIGGEVHVKAWQDLIVPIVTEVVRELSKGEASNQKLFGIDDAILIPAIVSVVAAAVKQQKGIGLNIGGGLSTPLGGAQLGVGFQAKAWQDLIVPIVTEVVRAISDQQKSIMPPPYEPFSDNNLLDRIRWQLAGAS